MIAITGGDLVSSPIPCRHVCCKAAREGIDDNLLSTSDCFAIWTYQPAALRSRSPVSTVKCDRCKSLNNSGF